MPSVLVRRRLEARARAQARRGPKRAARAAGAAFHEVASIPTATTLDAWGGWDGSGWGPAGSLWATSGNRQGGQSKVWRLDAPDGTWVDDLAPGGAEVLNKIRSGPSPGGEDRLWVFFESPSPSQRFIISRLSAGSGIWTFEGGLPADDAAGGHTVGGRGLAINGPGGGRVFAGGSYNWNSANTARVFEMQAGGGWAQRRDRHPSLMWELEFDALGRLWEFYNDFGTAGNGHLYVNGVEKGQPPGGDISSANWFPVSGHMYTIGALASGGGGAPQEGPRNEVNRSADGSAWGRVHTFNLAQQGDHVLYVPRGAGEMWATAHDPFQVAYSLDGFSWTVEPTVPAIGTGRDTNHLTAVAYWKDAVWVFTRDAGQNKTRVFTDFTENGGNGGNGGGPGPEPEPPTGVVFPSLALPPRPPELPTVPVEATQPTTKAADVFPKGDQPPMQKWVEGADKFVAEVSLRYDAIIGKWIDEFIRVVKDAWARLGVVINVMVARVAALETRVADTYTWGSGSITKDKIIALPLRVVRDETFLEMTVAAETASTEGNIRIDVTLNDTTLITGELSAGATFVAKEAGDLPKLTKDDKLAAMVRDAGKGAKGIVVQARCR